MEAIRAGGNDLLCSYASGAQCLSLLMIHNCPCCEMEKMLGEKCTNNLTGSTAVVFMANASSHA